MTNSFKILCSVNTDGPLINIVTDKTCEKYTRMKQILMIFENPQTIISILIGIGVTRLSAEIWGLGWIGSKGIGLDLSSFPRKSWQRHNTTCFLGFLGDVIKL